MPQFIPTYLIVSYVGNATKFMMHYSAICNLIFEKNILPLTCIYVLESLKQIHKNLPSLTLGDLHSYNNRFAGACYRSFLKATELNTLYLRLFNYFNNYFTNYNIKQFSSRKFIKRIFL